MWPVRSGCPSSSPESCVIYGFEEFFEKDSLSTLKTISEARIARHGLPAWLMARMKGSVKT
jgi:hypothetical protein